MSHVTTVEGMVLDTESLYKDLEGVVDILSFLISHLYDYVTHDDRGCEIVEWEREDGESFREDGNYIERFCDGKIVEWMVNKTPQWLTDDDSPNGFDPLDINCSRITHWLECDYNVLIQDYLDWKG